MRIQHNIPAMSSYRNYTNNTNALAKNLEKLSSGYRINRAGDDAAGLAISEKMRAQITGLKAAQKNVKDGTSLVKTAEGAMQEIHDMLNRMDYLATQSANGTYQNAVDREALQKEVTALKDEINRIADSANFNGIKLLDGSLSSQNLTAEGVKASTKSIIEGLTINEGANGGGTKGEATIDVSSLFGTGDTLAIEFTDTSLGTSGTKTLTYGTDITGATAEEQAASIQDLLSKDANISQKFDVKVNGSKVTLTAKAEGASEAAVKSVKVNDKGVTFGTGDYTLGTANAAAKKMEKGGFTQLFDGTAASLDVKDGDVLTFTFKDAQGNANLVAKVNVTKDMIGGSPADTTTNIVNALKEAKFENKDGTVADESRFKVGDLFDIRANMKLADGTSTEQGSVYVAAKLDGQFDIASVARSNAEDSSRDKTVNAATAGQAGTANVASKYEVTRTDDGTNFSAGDVIELTGSLSDGRNFNIKLTAGTDFAIGNTYAATLTNMKTQLEKTGDGATKVTLNDGKQVDAGEIFGTSKEITIGTPAATGITFTSAKAGPVQAGIGGGISNVSFSASDPADVKTEITKGTDPSAAESSFTFDKDVGYGTAITVGGKTYELVADARDVTNRSNEAVVVGDLSDPNAIASAFAQKINENAPSANDPADADAKEYTATADGATVKITTHAKGSDVKAMEITTPYGDEVPTVSFKFDPSMVQAGSYMTISDGTNSNTYEFVKKGEKASSGRTAIEVSDFNKIDAKAMGEAFANVAKGATVEVGDDGTVTITANEAEGSIPKLNVSFYDGKGGLKLQLGDTSDEYNQLKVSINDMHTTALGIADLDISTQEGAAAAIDVVKNAINYVSDVRGGLGAIQNRLEHTANNLSVMAENIQDAESSIRDTDVAEEMMSYVKNNILVQSAQAMLAQANQLPQGVLQLLG